MKTALKSFDLAREGILVLDPQWRILSANHCARELMSSAQMDLAGIDFWDALEPSIAEQQRGLTNTSVKLSGRHVFVAHLRFEDRAIEYAFHQETIGLVVNLTNVTDAKKGLRLLEESEQRNQVLFDTNPNAMWVFDIDTGKILEANQAATRFYRIPHKKFLTLKVGALFPDGEGAALLQSVAVKKNAAADEPFMQLCKQKKAGGTIVLTELASNRVEWKGRPCLLVTIADVSTRHVADTQLRRQNAELERLLEQKDTELNLANRDLQAFERAMSHDLKDPLHVLNGFARALAEKHASALEGQALHYVQRIQASTLQLAQLVDDLRALTRLPRMPVSLEAFDLVPACRLILDGFRRREPGRQVLVELPEALPVASDQNLLVTVMVHLLANAWKFTAKKEQAWIRIGLMPDTPAGEKILFVSDNGAGFDMGYQDKLFTAFQRLHSSADFAGNGLGLVLVKRIAAKLGGRVWAESIEGHGASFFLALPAVSLVDAAEGLPLALLPSAQTGENL